MSHSSREKFTFVTGMKNKLLIVILFIGFAHLTSAQVTNVLQVSGVVVATDSLLPVPFATVFRSTDHRGTFTDYNGYFTMPARAGDTLYFVSIGLKSSSFVVPNDTVNTHLSIVQWMEETEIMLPTVNVLPYPAPYKLREEMLSLDLPGDRYYKFERGVASAAAYDGLHDLSDDAFRESSETLIARYTSGFRSGGNLLDPNAWGKFMKALKSGDREKN